MIDSDEPASGTPLYPCGAIGCEIRSLLVELKAGAGGVYCRSCARVERAVFAVMPQAVLDDAQVALLRLRCSVRFADGFPEALPCLGCVGAPRAALSGTLTCTNRCARRVSQYARRSLRLVQLHGLVLPEKTWHQLIGLSASGYRMRRLILGVPRALELPVDERQRRAGRARHHRPEIPEDVPGIRMQIADISVRVRSLT